MAFEWVECCVLIGQNVNTVKVVSKEPYYTTHTQSLRQRYLGQDYVFTCMCCRHNELSECTLHQQRYMLDPKDQLLL